MTGMRGARKVARLGSFAVSLALSIPPNCFSL